MASDPDVRRLTDRKLELLRDVLESTREALLVVELETLAPLQQRQDGLIGQLTEVDLALAALGEPARKRMQEPGFGAELTRLVEAILENQRTMEARMEEEHRRLRRELHELDQQSRVRGYLERQQRRPGRVDLTR